MTSQKTSYGSPLPVLALLLLLGVLGVAVGGQPAHAQSGRVTWGVQPADTEHGTDRPNFAYELDPGDMIEDAVVVTNHTPTEITFRIYAADGFTTPSGFLDLLPAGEPSVGLGTWITFPTAEITLGPDERREVPLTLTVPEDTTAGDHSGGVVTSVVTAGAGEGVTQDNRLGNRVHVRVRGELAASVAIENLEVRYDASANPFAPGRATITYDLVNTGNVRVAGHETVRLSGPLGLGAHVVAGELPELVTGSDLPRELVVEGVWPLLRTPVEVSVQPVPVGIGAGGTAAAPVALTAAVWTVPWVLLGLVLLTVLAAVAVGRRGGARRRPQPSPTPAAEAPTPTGPVPSAAAGVTDRQSSDASA